MSPMAAVVRGLYVGFTRRGRRNDTRYPLSTSVPIPSSWLRMSTSVDARRRHGPPRSETVTPRSSGDEARLAPIVERMGACSSMHAHGDRRPRLRRHNRLGVEPVGDDGLHAVAADLLQLGGLATALAIAEEPADVVLPHTCQGVEMGRRGRKRQRGVEDENWKLILSGVGTVDRVPAGRCRAQDRLPVAR